MVCSKTDVPYHLRRAYKALWGPIGVTLPALEAQMNAQRKHFEIECDLALVTRKRT
jgi:hypothetical protein